MLFSHRCRLVAVVALAGGALLAVPSEVSAAAADITLDCLAADPDGAATENTDQQNVELAIGQTMTVEVVNCDLFYAVGATTPTDVYALDVNGASTTATVSGAGWVAGYTPGSIALIRNFAVGTATTTTTSPATTTTIAPTTTTTTTVSPTVTTTTVVDTVAPTEPPVTESSVTEPPATEPPVTESSSTGPEDTIVDQGIVIPVRTPPVEDGIFVIVLGGWKPLSDVEVVIDQVDLGTFTADVDGVVTVEVALPPGLRPGVYEVEISGYNAAGEYVTVAVPAEVTAPVGVRPAAPLPVTGPGERGLSGAGLVLLVLGATAVAASRRRTTRG